MLHQALATDTSPRENAHLVGQVKIEPEGFKQLVMLCSKLINTAKETTALPPSKSRLYTLKPIKSAVSTLSVIVFLFGCSATPMPTVAQNIAPHKAGKSVGVDDEAIERKADCALKNTLAAKEECFAMNQFSDCNKDDMRCDPYKQMYFAENKLHAVLGEIEVLTAKSYARYLIDDPEYIRDAILHSRSSNESWKKYRDSYCISEQYSSGMSRHEINDVAELCRIRKTEERIVELDELLAAIKSNMGK
jgi:hypothetical protein